MGNPAHVCTPGGGYTSEKAIDPSKQTKVSSTMMDKSIGGEHIRLKVIQLCHAGLDSWTLRAELLKRLRKVMWSNEAFFATIDPTTLLFTGAVVDPVLERAAPLFLDNEFLQDDVLKIRWMAQTHQLVGTLYEATQGDLRRSPRYRRILAPINMGNELRAVFLTDSACWGSLCLHRENSSAPFTPAEIAFLKPLTPHIAEGLRKALLLGSTAAPQRLDGPGVLLLADDFSPVTITPSAQHWLAELSSADKQPAHALPMAVRSVATRLQALEGSHEGWPELMPKVRVRAPSGMWLTLHASWLAESFGGARMVVIFERAQPAEITPLIVQAYDLSRRERELVQLVLQGYSTSEIAATLCITAHTVQDHLKAIFEKVDVRSRRELVARIYTQHYQPHIAARHSLDATGWFA
jgi:DNA-binding CsgD family transcriptional regulator